MILIVKLNTKSRDLQLWGRNTKVPSEQQLNSRKCLNF